jgi:hypothetical protein
LKEAHVSGTATIEIRIFRKSNGLVQAHPSPVILKKDRPFTILNTTDEKAEVTFLSGDFRTEKSPILIAPHERSEDIVPRTGARYVEYDVKLERGHCAEGSSKPGAIIDP